jgi:hypothetical protein
MTTIITTVATVATVVLPRTVRFYNGSNITMLNVAVMR